MVRHRRQGRRKTQQNKTTRLNRCSTTRKPTLRYYITNKLCLPSKVEVDEDDEDLSTKPNRIPDIATLRFSIEDSVLSNVRLPVNQRNDSLTKVGSKQLAGTDLLRPTIFPNTYVLIDLSGNCSLGEEPILNVLLQLMRHRAVVEQMLPHTGLDAEPQLTSRASVIT